MSRRRTHRGSQEEGKETNSGPYDCWYGEKAACMVLETDVQSLRTMAVRGESEFGLVRWVFTNKEGIESNETRWYYIVHPDRQPDARVLTKARQFEHNSKVLAEYDANIQSLLHDYQRPAKRPCRTGGGTLCDDPCHAGGGTPCDDPPVPDSLKGDATDALEALCPGKGNVTSAAGFVESYKSLEAEGKLWRVGYLRGTCESTAVSSTVPISRQETSSESAITGDATSSNTAVHRIETISDIIAVVDRSNNLADGLNLVSGWRLAEASSCSGMLWYILAIVQLVLFTIGGKRGAADFLSRYGEGILVLFPRFWFSDLPPPVETQLAQLGLLATAVRDKATFWESCVTNAIKLMAHIPRFPQPRPTSLYDFFVMVERAFGGSTGGRQDRTMPSASPIGSRRPASRALSPSPSDTPPKSCRKQTKEHSIAFRYYICKLHSLIPQVGIGKILLVLLVSWLALLSYIPSKLSSVQDLVAILPSRRTVKKWMGKMGSLNRLRTAARIAGATGTELTTTVVYTSVDVGHRSKSDLMPLLLFWWDFEEKKPKFIGLAASLVGKSGLDSALVIIYLISQLQILLQASGFHQLSPAKTILDVAGSMTDGASNMLCTMATRLRQEYGSYFLAANCVMHVISILFSAPYLFCYPLAVNEVPSPLSLLKNLTWLLHDTMDPITWRTLIISEFPEDKALQKKLTDAISDAILLTRWGTVSKALSFTMQNWDALITLMALIEEGCSTQAQERAAAGRVWEWMTHYAWLKAQCLFLNVYITMFHNYAFAYAQSATDSVTKTAGFRSHRMPRFYARMYRDLTGWETSNQRRVSGKFDLYYAKLDGLPPGQIITLERQHDKFIELALNSVQKHSRIWFTTHLFMALGDDLVMARLVAQLLLASRDQSLDLSDPTLQLGEAHAITELEASIKLLDDTCPKKSEGVAAAGGRKRYTYTDHEGKAIRANAYELHVKELKEKRAKLEKLEAAAAATAFKLSLEAREKKLNAICAAHENISHRFENTTMETDLHEIATQIASSLMLYTGSWPLGLNEWAATRRLADSGMDQPDLAYFLRARVYCHPHHSQMTEQQVKNVARVQQGKGRGAMSLEELSNRYLSTQMTTATLHTIASSEEMRTRFFAANAVVHAGYAGSRAWKSEDRSGESKGDDRSSIRFDNKHMFVRFAHQLRAEEPSKEEYDDAVDAQRYLDTQLLKEDHPEIKRVAQKASGIVKQAAQTREGATTRKRVHVSHPGTDFALPMIGSGVNGIVKVGSIRNTVGIKAELEARGISHDGLDYKGLLKALKDHADNDGDRVGRGMIKLSSFSDDDGGGDA